MAKKKSPEAMELPLFDLPLQADGQQKESKGSSWLEESVDPPLAESPKPPSAGNIETEETGPGETEDGALEQIDPDEEEIPAPFRDRVLAGLLDLGIQLLVLGAAVAAVHAMGIELGFSGGTPAALAVLAPFAVLGLIFSFLYWFVPLAFWGQTPGMAWVGNSSLSLNDEPLTFGQSVLRWFGALLTLALLGLPLLLALSGRSLTDRLSDSKTVLLS